MTTETGEALWSRLRGPEHLTRYARRAVRVVEGQHRIATRKLVRSDADQAILEGLLETVKPPVPADVAARGLHYLLSTPFRHPPLRHGSRFGSRQERGIFYAAERIETALAEVAYYRLLFLEGTRADPGPLLSDMTAFRVRLASDRAADLAVAPFAAHRQAISSPVSYRVSQGIGRAMRAAGVDLFRYFSARDPRGGVNVGVFQPVAFAVPRPERPETWLCVASRDAVELRRRDPFARGRSYRFPREGFEVRGALPHPGV